MLRRISVVLLGLLALGFLATSPAAAGGNDVEVGWLHGSHASTSNVDAHDFQAGFIGIH
ncbi:hypothetical protein ACIRD2_08010 [Streptomyces sp. NPDC093595]|uniref:hypothetical protein n=1 Tax=unclassified Streptomyces TaxID=2593676 RepID=UPI00379F11E4